MVDLDCFFTSFKAVWASRIINHGGKWADFTLKQANLNSLKTIYVRLLFRKTETFPFIEYLPHFYQEVSIAFSKAFDLLNNYDLMQQPLWGNEYFKIRGTCLYYRR